MNNTMTDLNTPNKFTEIIGRIKLWYKYVSLRREVLRKRRELSKAMFLYPEEARTTIEIVKLQAKKKKSEVLYAPVSGEFYITNDEKFIILKNCSVNIINGVYHYYVDVPCEAQEYLDKYLKRIVERKRSKIKRHIESKITRSLNDILDHVKED